MRRTLSGKDPAALLASQGQNNSEVLPVANSFEWARETRTSKQVPAGACGSLVALPYCVVPLASMKAY
jgi:hypothetical protein